jgi:ABC-type Na+ efflux pump permease subunit
MTERVNFSLRRVWTIAANTFTESVRQKVFNILLIFALVVIALASFFAQFTVGENIAQAASYQLKSVKDTCFGAMSIIGMLIAVVGTGMLLPNELENRTIYTILSKPVRRVEFLLGKYFGVVILTLVSVILMSVMFVAVLTFKQARLVADARVEYSSRTSPEDQQRLEADMARVQTDGYSSEIWKGILLIFVKLCLLVAVTLLVSTFSTSLVFNVAVGLLVILAGQFVGVAREAWHQHTVVLYVLGVVPDLKMFDVTDTVLAGTIIPWGYVAKVVTYGGVYLSCVLGAAYLIFSSREI